MSVHDFYVISPYLAMAGAAVFVILLDLFLPQRSKGLLPYFAFAALAGPFVMTLIQFYDLGGGTNLLQGAEAFATEDPSILLGAISLDRFALAGNGRGGHSRALDRCAVREYDGCSRTPSGFLGFRVACGETRG